jgi:spermidine synthase
VVAIAFKRKRPVALEALAARAAQIVADTKLPAKSWVKGITAAIAAM